jgi:hypothetical protein
MYWLKYFNEGALPKNQASSPVFFIPGLYVQGLLMSCVSVDLGIFIDIYQQFQKMTGIE